MDAPTIMVTLDRERPVRWSHRALSRLQRVTPPVGFEDLSHPQKALGALHAFIWAALIDKNHRFAYPEDLAEYITPERAMEAMEVLARLFEGEFEPAEKKTDSATGGPSPSSS